MEPIQDLQWLLSLGTFLPLVGVLLMLFVPKKDVDTAKTIAVATAIATLAVGVVTALKFDYVRGRGRDRFNNLAEHAFVLFSLATYF